MKKWRDLIHLNPGTDQPVDRAVRVVLNEDATVSCLGNSEIIADLNESGIYRIGSVQPLFPKDGPDFFQSLGEYFNNPMNLQASDIHEDEIVPSLPN